jgi:predicted metal-dependent phosphoesterase TrpH
MTETTSTPTATRADLHCHSTASAISKLGVSRALGLPECATPPEEVYALAKRRGMDFVTITDHDTIDGALAIADRADVFVSEELTAHFAGEPQAVHVLCLGITPDDPRLAAGPRGRRRARRAVPPRRGDRVRARPPVLLGGGAADAAPPAAARRALRRLGGS